MRHAIWVPLFGELADPRAAVDLAVEAEERDWDGPRRGAHGPPA